MPVRYHKFGISAISDSPDVTKTPLLVAGILLAQGVIIHLNLLLKRDSINEIGSMHLHMQLLGTQAVTIVDCAIQENKGVVSGRQTQRH